LAKTDAIDARVLAHFRRTYPADKSTIYRLLKAGKIPSFRIGTDIASPARPLMSCRQSQEDGIPQPPQNATESPSWLKAARFFCAKLASQEPRVNRYSKNNRLPGSVAAPQGSHRPALVRR
jgi:hypothetical protein